LRRLRNFARSVLGSYARPARGVPFLVIGLRCVLDVSQSLGCHSSSGSQRFSLQKSRHHPDRAIANPPPRAPRATRASRKIRKKGDPARNLNAEHVYRPRRKARSGLGQVWVRSGGAYLRRLLQETLRSERALSKNAVILSVAPGVPRPKRSRKISKRCVASEMSR